MRREADGRQLLHGLLDRFERTQDQTRRIISRPSANFASAEAHRLLDDILIAARDAGAVELAFDRDAPHLIEKVILADASRLYVHLDRRPAVLNLKDALARLAGLSPGTDVGQALVAHISECWRAGRNALALSPSDLNEAVRLVRAADAAFTPLPGGRVPLRTRSARLLNDSKALERSLSKLLSFLKETGRLDPEQSREEALRVLGLEKYPQPLLLAGPFLIGNLSVADWTYAGLPPEAGDVLALGGKVTSILTVENLESFNRHVRECRGPTDAVIYTGGFPSAGVVTLLGRLIELSGVNRVWHWGDIDGGGIKIGRYLERMLSRPVVPHLMSAALAEAHGAAAPALATLREIPSGSSFSPLALYLASSGAHWLEQEVLDPVVVGAEWLA